MQISSSSDTHVGGNIARCNAAQFATIDVKGTDITTESLTYLFTLMPFELHSFDRALVYRSQFDIVYEMNVRNLFTIPTTPCFAVAYAGTVNPPVKVVIHI